MSNNSSWFRRIIIISMPARLPAIERIVGKPIEQLEHSLSVALVKSRSGGDSNEMRSRPRRIKTKEQCKPAAQLTIVLDGMALAFRAFSK
jgi:hypothetical protein